MNYEDMSDWEVTKRVVEIRCAGQFIKYQPQRDAFKPISSGVMDDALYITTESGREQKIDCCSNPSDAWPIITSNDINLSKHKVDDYWFAFTRAEDLGVSEFKCKDSNPLRAACICFLKLKDAEK